MTAKQPTIVLSHPAQSPLNISAVSRFICVCKAPDKPFVKERLALSVTVFKGTKRLLSRAMLQSMATPSYPLSGSHTVCSCFMGHWSIFVGCRCQLHWGVYQCTPAMDLHPDRFGIDWSGEGEALYIHTNIRHSSGHMKPTWNAFYSCNLAYFRIKLKKKKGYSMRKKLSDLYEIN